MVPPQTPDTGATLLNRLVIDTQTAEPMYLQLERQLHHMIQSGELPAGYSLPSERVLADALGLSRTTAKRCYDALRARNLISTHGRLGTQVRGSRRLEPGLDRLKGFTEEMRLLNMRASSRILEQSVVTDRAISSIFGRPATARFLRLVRLRYGDDIPLSRETAWYDLGLLPELDKGELGGSLYDTMAHTYGIHLDGCEQSIEAVSPSTEECGIFGFREPIPCLLIKRQTFTREQQMVEYVEGLFRGDRYAYRLRLPAH